MQNAWKDWNWPTNFPNRTETPKFRTESHRFEPNRWKTPKIRTEFKKIKSFQKRVKMKWQTCPSAEFRVPKNRNAKPNRTESPKLIADSYRNTDSKNIKKPIRFDNFSKTQMLSRKGIRSADLIRDQAVFVYFFIFPNLFKYASEKWSIPTEEINRWNLTPAHQFLNNKHWNFLWKWINQSLLH